MIYLDNAATTFPKPKSVLQAMTRFMQEIGANPGRASHRLAIEAGRILIDAREALATLFGVEDPLRIVFTPNATEGLNLVLQGYLRPGDHVVTSSMEHNAVMRPLRRLESEGIGISIARCDREGQLSVAEVKRHLRPATRLVILNHASNVTGTILPVAQVGDLARDRNILFAVDGAQTAGAIPIDFNAMNIDFLIFSGHKGLYGPMGTGGVVLGERVDLERLRPLKSGGTGSRSAEEEQPDFMPDRYESGTPNAVGIAGLESGVRFLLSRGVETIRAHEIHLLQMLLSGLAKFDRIIIHGPRQAEKMTATVSFIISGMSVSVAAARLEEEHDILCRIGLHCAPAAHRTIGTHPEGTIRFSLGCFTTEADIHAALEGVRCLAQE